MPEDLYDPKVEVADPRFPPQHYEDDHVLDNNTPWQTDVVPFDPKRTYTAAEKDLITRSEKELFSATETQEKSKSGEIEKQLNVTHPPNPQASFPPPKEDVYPQDESTPPTPFSNRRAFVSQNSFGNRLFGARYWNETSALSNLRNRVMEIQSLTEFVSTIFNNDRTVAVFDFVNRIECGATGLPPLSRLATARFFLMGQLQPPRTWNTSFNRGQRQNVFRRDNMTFFNVRKTFMVGPVPLTVTASVRGNVGLDLSGDLECTGLGLDARPFANLQVVTSAAVNVILLQFGVEGALHLIEVALPSQARMDWAESLACPNWSTTVNRQVSTLNGSINLFTIVRFIFFRQRYDLNIANWRGVTWNNQLHHASGTVCPSAQLAGAH